MYTSIYYPKNNPVTDQFGGVAWIKGDYTRYANLGVLNGPSYCVRLWVFDYDCP